MVTHDQAIAARMRRQVRMLDGHIISDSGAGDGRAAAAMPGETGERLAAWGLPRSAQE